MTYSANVSADNPLCILFLVDQSSSMAETVGGQLGTRKADAVADAINHVLQALCFRSLRGNEIREYFSIGLVGYGDGVQSVWGGALAGQGLVPIGQISQNPLRIETQTKLVDDGAGGIVERTLQHPVWLDPVAHGMSRIVPALELVRDMVAAFVAEHPDSFPPIVVNLIGSSGPLADDSTAAAITKLQTTDGAVLFFNIQLSSFHSTPSVFPCSAKDLTDHFSRELFHQSSKLPAMLVENARAQGFEIQADARGLALNADSDTLARFLEITLIHSMDVGTRSAVREEPVASTTIEKPVTSPRVDENVQFTTYCPQQVVPEKFYTLVTFAHLAELPADAAEDEPDPVEEVQRQAQEVLGDKLESYRTTTQESAQPVPREGELVFVLELDGFRCNPSRQTISWEESVHKVEFRIKAPATLDGQTCRGRLSVFLGDILLADTNLRIRVSSTVTPAESRAKQADVRRYRKIFASYSRRDLAVVEQFERFASTLGDRYLRDLVDLRAGEGWNDGLKRMIEEADVFQLFWSSNSMTSEFVRQEWEYALSLGRPNFIRPTYWEQPFPEVPGKLPSPSLREVHFQLLGRFQPSVKDAVDDGAAIEGIVSDSVPNDTYEDFEIAPSEVVGLDDGESFENDESAVTHDESDFGSFDSAENSDYELAADEVDDAPVVAMSAAPRPQASDSRPSPSMKRSDSDGLSPVEMGIALVVGVLLIVGIIAAAIALSSPSKPKIEEVRRKFSAVMLAELHTSTTDRGGETIAARTQPLVVTRSR